MSETFSSKLSHKGTPTSSQNDLPYIPQQSSDTSFLLYLQRTIGNQALQRLLASPPRSGKASASIQRAITFNGQKQFEDIAHLKRHIKSLFAKKHHEKVDTLVDNAESMGGRAVGAVNVYQQIMRIADGEGWARTIQPGATPSVEHGPQLPEQNATGTDRDIASAMSTFMFSTITSARADITLPSRKRVSFEGRNNTSTKEHAEDVLITKINEYFQRVKTKPSACQLRITLNNLPCHTGEGEKDCSQTLRDYAQQRGFSQFHIYYVNNYGANPGGSIKNMQAEGIKVSQFSPRQVLSTQDRHSLKSATLEKIDNTNPIAPTGVGLDPWSDSNESQSEEGDDSGWQKAGSKRSRGSKKLIPNKKSRVQAPSFVIENWNHRKNLLPDWVIGRGVYAGQRIRINGNEFRVIEDKKKSVKPTDDNPQGKYMYAIPYLRGG
jgi:hypothetical protein